jgi:hypothetical protein
MSRPFKPAHPFLKLRRATALSYWFFWRPASIHLIRLINTFFSSLVFLETHSLIKVFKSLSLDGSAFSCFYLKNFTRKSKIVCSCHSTKLFFFYLTRYDSMKSLYLKLYCRSREFAFADRSILHIQRDTKGSHSVSPYSSRRLSFP